MPFLTKFGSHYGATPLRTGNQFFVAPSATYTLVGPQGQRSYSASDEHDGLSPERALRTVARAIVLSVANSGDVIRLLRGTHAVTATVVPKAGVAILGEPTAFGLPIRGMLKYPTTLSIRGTADELLNITTSDIEIGYLNLQGSQDFSVISFQTHTGLIGFYLHDYYLDMDVPTPSRATKGIDFGFRSTDNTARWGTVVSQEATAYIANGMHMSNGANGEALLLATASVECVNLRFHNNQGTWATPVLVATGTDNTLFESCLWSSSGTMTLAAAGPVFAASALIADGVHFNNCRVTAALATAASAFIGFTAGGVAGANLSENYLMGGPTTASNGGTLLTRA